MDRGTAKRDLAKAGISVTAEVPKTLLMLLKEFFHQHVDEKLAPKTVERYHEQAAYLAPELLAMPIGEITPLHFEPRVESAPEERRAPPGDEAAAASLAPRRFGTSRALSRAHSRAQLSGDL